MFITKYSNPKKTLNLSELDSISRTRIGETKFNYLFDIVLQEINKIDVNLYNHLKLLLENEMIKVSNTTNIGYSFCANLPISDLSYIYIEKDETYEDIFNLCHEIGHAYFFYNIGKIPNYKIYKEITQEYFAFIFEYYLALKLATYESYLFKSI